jgi:DNA-directed RNA polymerase specialized sigma24 family protein
MISRVARREETQARGALGELYVRHAPEGIRLAYLLTGDRALAEDLVQEAFARFDGRLHSLRKPEAFGAYLRTSPACQGRAGIRGAARSDAAADG